MHDQPTCGRVLTSVQHENDVLRHLLDEYPAPSTVEELVSELAPPGEEGRMQRDGVKTAIADLAARGLLRHNGFYRLADACCEGRAGLDVGGVSGR